MDIIGGQHLRQMWDDLADVYGHKTALICESSSGVVNRYSYLELNQEINRTANLFYTLGIRKGDKVALHLDNCPEFIFCWFGLAKIGAIMVPINARLLREESTWILQNSQACLLVTSAQFYPMYQQIQQEDASQLRHICLTDMYSCPVFYSNAINGFPTTSMVMRSLSFPISHVVRPYSLYSSGMVKRSRYSPSLRFGKM